MFEVYLELLLLIVFVHFTCESVIVIKNHLKLYVLLLFVVHDEFVFSICHYRKTPTVVIAKLKMTFLHVACYKSGTKCIVKRKHPAANLKYK